MTRLALLLFIVSSMILGTASLTFAQEYPASIGVVSDFADVISIEDEATLTADITAFEAETTIEIVVVTVKTTGSEDILDYAKGLGNSWGVGKVDQDNGVVILIAVDDRMFSIKPGSGLIEILTEDVISDIQDESIRPRLREGDYGQGMIDGVNGIEAILSVSSVVNTPAPVSSTSTPQEKSDGRSYWKFLIAGIIFIVVVVILAVFAYELNLRRKQRTWNLNKFGELVEKAGAVAVKKKSAQATYTTIKSQWPESIWNRYDSMMRELEKRTYASALREIEALSRSIYHTDRVQTELVTFESILNQDLSFLSDVCDLPEMIESAKESCARLLKSAQVLLQSAESITGSQMNMEGVRASIEELHQRLLEKSEELDPIQGKSLDWLEQEKILEKLAKQAKYVQNLASEASALNKRAEEEGPGLLDKLSSLIEDMEQRAERNPRLQPHLDEARSIYQQALHLQQIQGTLINWLPVYWLLMTAHDNATFSPPSHSSHSYSGSSSSYDSGFSGSSPSFGGGGFSDGGSSASFGGGGFSDGGSSSSF